MNINKNFSIILQQDGRPPKYMEFDQKKSKALFILFPLMGLIFFFSTISIFFYFGTLKAKFLLEKPNMEKKYLSKQYELEKELDLLKEKNQQLSSELIFNDSTPFSKNQFIRVLPSSKDKTSEQLVEIDLKKISNKPNNYSVSFNITNQSVVQRVSGYFFTILKNKNVMQLYPKKDTLFNSISFKDGEYFSTSRFRPVQINFNKFDLLNKAELVILIFSRNGDLIHSSSEKLDIQND